MYYIVLLTTPLHYWACQLTAQSAYNDIIDPPTLSVSELTSVPA